MRIRRPDGYLTNCPHCNYQLHFYENDIIVGTDPYSDDRPIISLEEWEDLPYEEALNYTCFFPESIPVLRNFIKCPNCGKYKEVWHTQIWYGNSIENLHSKNMKDLIEEGKIFTFRNDYEIERVYGPEEEL